MAGVLKQRGGNSMRKLRLILLVVLVFSVYAKDQKPLVVESDKELKGVTDKKILWKKDGAKMVLIPAGSFQMGDHFNEGKDNEWPVHKVELNAFYMDVTEVTVGQFKKFVQQTGYGYGGDWNHVAKYSPGDDYPMIYVSWHDAVAYAEWAGKQLPTEAEWEKAARGGLEGKRYPWGDGDPTGKECNFADTNVNENSDHVEGWYTATAPAGNFEANSYGLYDMAGNVYEWCADWYGTDYYSKSSAKNPIGPNTGAYRVLRGGSCYFNTSTLRVADRNVDAPNNRFYLNGIRCVANIE